MYGLRFTEVKQLNYLLKAHEGVISIAGIQTQFLFLPEPGLLINQYIL